VLSGFRFHGCELADARARRPPADHALLIA
jgi:hypothetical protein